MPKNKAANTPVDLFRFATGGQDLLGRTINQMATVEPKNHIRTSSPNMSVSSAPLFDDDFLAFRQKNKETQDDIARNPQKKDQTCPDGTADSRASLL